MYKQDLALNNLQRLICHKIEPNQTNNYVSGYVKHHQKFPWHLKDNLFFFIFF